MSVEKWRFKIEGKTGGGNSYSTEGEIEADIADPSIHRTAMLASFLQLTNGRAVFGTPGAGCRGPYSVTRFLLEKVTQ